MAFIFTAQSETIKKVIKTHVSVSVDSQIFQNQKHSPGARWYSQAKAKQAQLGNVLNKSRKVIDKVVDDPLTAVKDGAEKVVQTGKETIVKGQRTMEKVSKQGKNVVLEVTQQGMCRLQRRRWYCSLPSRNLRLRPLANQTLTH